MANKTTALIMVTFREAIFGFEIVRDYATNEQQVLCNLEYVEDKYVYLFTSNHKKTGYRLTGEYFGLGGGEFAIACIDEYRGKDERPYSSVARKYMLAPAVFEGKELEHYACLSKIQLPWKRIEEICKDPSKRCFRIGAAQGGLCWIPGCVERNLQSLSGVSDPRIADPGGSIVVIGLFDHLREATRRSEVLRIKIDAYLQLRFDCDKQGDTTETHYRHQMKKYCAGLVLNLVKSNHPQADRFKDALKNGARDLEEFIREENMREIDARQAAEKAAYSVNRWMDDPEGIFEEVLADYTITHDNQMHWDCIIDYYCSLLNRFNELSITRKYLNDKLKNKDSWLNRYLLNGDAFQGYRKVTNAVVQFLTVMSEVAYRTVDIEETCKTMQVIYRIWFEGIVLEVFSNKLKKNSESFLASLSKTPQIKVVRKIRISAQCEPLEKLGKFVDAKLTHEVLLAIEAVNMVLAAMDWIEKRSLTGVDRIVANTNTLGSFFDLLVAIGETSKKAGKTPLAFLGTASAAIDCGLALYASTEEFKDKDYNAMISKLVVGTGAATIAVGSAMVAATAFCAAFSACGSGASLLIISQTVWMYGVGATASGVGCPIGGALIFVGAVVFATGTIAYFFSNDSKTEEWLKKSPWGINKEWSFDEQSLFLDELDVLHCLIYSFKAEIWYDPWKEFAGIRVRSPFLQPETKITILEMELKGGMASEKIISVPLIIDERDTTTISSVEVKDGAEVDVVATIPFKTTLSDRDSIEATLSIDVYGNNKVVLPERHKSLSCKAQVYG